MMEFSIDQGQATYKIESYTPGCIVISGQKYFQSLLVMPEQLIPAWGPKEPESLQPKDFQVILELNPQVVLLGTGSKHKFLAPKLYEALTKSGIGVEVMDSAAACRTYSILMSEGRNVAAAIIL